MKRMLHSEELEAVRHEVHRTGQEAEEAIASSGDE